MTDADRAHEKIVLDRLADIRDRTEGDHWGLEVDCDDWRIIVRRATGEDAHICTIHAAALGDERELLCAALDHARLFVGMFARAASAVRELLARIDDLTRRQARKTDAQQAAILTADRQFQRFLETRGAGGPVRDKQAADTRLKSLLAIQSKTEIDTDTRARGAFAALRRDFYAWLRGGK